MPTASKLNGTLRSFIERQPMFFVATAGQDTRVNLSPKGMDTLRVMDDTRIVWLNLTGSGNETAAHLREVNRMTLMFCAFDGDALILRTYGQCKTLHPRDAGFDALSRMFPEMAGSRQIFDLSIDLVQTSCGTGVPLMETKGQRGPAELVPYFDELGTEGVEAFWQRRNATSLDGKETGIVGE